MRRIQANFADPQCHWDGFGINYVEAAQTRDYEADPQDYGGFSTLSEADRQAILDMTFGDDGLKPGVVKMFLDCLHQEEPGEGYSRDPNVIAPDAYDHERTTRWMRYFVREGLRRTRARGDEMEIITTMYGPPAWTTQQRFVRGRDLDRGQKFEAAKYLISWAKYLREAEGLPVKYVCLHNEGEDWMRWPSDGSTGGTANHDHNLYWPPEQVVDFLGFMRPMLDAQGMQDVGIAPGETTNWYRFHEWGYADAIADDDSAVQNLGLITSHGFYGTHPRWFGDWRSAGIDAIRAKRPGLDAWVTSTSWSKMDALFVWEIHSNIYSAKVNAIIPWAAVQQSGKWAGGDPNPGTAFRVAAQGGSYTVEPGYYFYKQVCRAGQPGMAVARVASNDSQVSLIAFASNGTRHPDALIVVNIADDAHELPIGVMGTEATTFEAYRTSAKERYVPVGTCPVRHSCIAYTAPPGQ